MDKKIIIGIIALVVIVCGAIAYFTIAGTQQLEDAGLVKSEFVVNFYSDNSQVHSIESEIESFKTNPYLKDDVNNDTVKWIEGFGNNEYVYINCIGNYNLIIKRSDYDTLKSQIDTSGLADFDYYKAVIKANVVETHSLGSGFKDIVYIQNIELINTTKESI